MVWSFISTWCKVGPIFVFSVKDIVNLHEHMGQRNNAKGVFKGIIMVECWVL
ncbi:hypothetical protein HanRHA438_Chr14g0634401 [Helianthus annuus]|nr:hypothetical protein HanRHA438_Chr14g0634401 [Helianthus annuus]